MSGLEFLKYLIFYFPTALMFAVLSETKTLPLLIANYLKKFKYIITEDILKEFDRKKSVLTNNREIDNYNKKL
jgi:hypothetical protein